MTKNELLRRIKDEVGLSVAKRAATKTRSEAAALLERHRKTRFLADLSRARTAQKRIGLSA